MPRETRGRAEGERHDRAVRRGQRLAALSREFWATATPEQKEEMKRRSWIGYRAKNPERAALVEQTWDAIHAGDIERQPCDTCGAPAKPLFDWASLTLVGWRCLACRKGARV